MNLQKKAWDTLSVINVNDKTETKGTGKYALTYLSWAWAWGVLMEHFPQSSYTIHEDRLLPDGSVIVGVTLTIKEGEEEFSRYMWLPVMDHMNKSIKNPDAMAINKAYMRCLAKAIAMCGLGHYIYAGDDLPNEEDDKESPKPKSPSNSKPSTQTTNSTPPPQTKKSTIEQLKDGLRECKSKQALEERYSKQMPWLEQNRPELIDEYNSFYDECLFNLTM
ncbi:hypothetical protein HS327_00744 [Glaesserella parasuis]|uniref:Sak single strand annealing protein n=1 Tax=Glaesserella parasuis TaxID=738 RepID=UPI0004DD1F61|nr:DUF1071 domain-containing protein [Glaesserella parasuis]KEZ23141.1 hypothetical protein HS327_00744 [Glaesserella parasuis]